MLRHFRLFAVLALSPFVMPLLYAQVTASVVGTVRDSSGAVVSAVKVTATNKDTGLTRTVQTDDQGSYAMTTLPIGTYSFTAELSGFKQSEVPNVVLQVAQQARVDVTLQPGDVKSTVEVSTEPSLIQTDTSSLGQVIDNKKIVDLPLNGRNFTQLAALTPGALTSSIPGGPPAGEQTGASTVSVSGGQSSKTEFLLDGITNQDQLYDGVQFSPSIDFIQEFRVQSNSFSAEYGRGSAVINVSSRSGTNAIHGTVFEFLRNNYFDAKNFFAQTTPPLRRNQFGGSIGGPVLKNKLFYFFNYEGTRLTQPTTNNVNVPTQAQRGGDFSGISTPLINPLTGQRFAGNQIPAGQIDPIAKFFLPFVPPPNTSSGQYIWNASNAQNADQGNVRVDYTLNESNSFFARYSANDFRGNRSGSLPTSGATNQTLNTKNAAVSYTHLFSPGLLNEARVGYGRLYSANLPEGLGTNYTVQSGILGFDQTSANFPGFPTISVSGYTSFTNGTPFIPIINPTNTYEFTDIVTWNKGRHSIRAGIDVRHFHLTSTNGAWSRGSFSYNGMFSGNALADYLLGYPSSGIRDFPRNQFGLKDLDYPLFVQDDIKVSPKLTVNLGLRYDLSSAPSQDLGQNSYFDLTRGKWIVSTYKNGQINLTTQQVAPYAYAAFSQYIITTKDAGIDNNIQTISRKNFAPRVGFAYRPFDNDRTVIRAGYGIFYLLQRGNNAVSNGIVNLPFIQDQFSSNFKTSSGAPAYTTQNLFAGPFSSNGLNLSSITLRIRPPYNQQWNFSIQQELVPTLALQLAYVGNKGTRLDRDLPFNYPTPGPGNPSLRRPLPQFGAGDLYTNAGDSSYHALQATLEKRFSAGLTFLSAFTWSKLIDDGNVSSSNFTYQDPSNLALDRGLGAFDVKYRSVNSFSYELPFGKGRRFGSAIPRALDLAAGGWQFAGIVTFQSGFPFSPTQSVDPSNTGYDYRPNVVGNPIPAQQTIQQWFNP
ncbi:MAG: carboxypeptidase regulatory-like domain-containing protein, partial [Acidobacteriaceae bacterium]|nr:carboxypeptidase regulatory-like domain-containing protein [Acidobacteriaceae bacterium]